MTGTTDGKEQQDKCHSDDTRGGLESLSGKGKSFGDEQNEADSGNSTWRSEIRKSDTSSRKLREKIIGGILRRLEQIEQTNLAFVNAHTKRLKARLADDEEQRQKIISEVQELKQEILGLLTTEDD